jgi:hypothetical protein
MPSFSVIVTPTSTPLKSSPTPFVEAAFSVPPGGDWVAIGDDPSGNPSYVILPGGAPMRFDPALWGGMLDLSLFNCQTANHGLPAWVTGTPYVAGVSKVTSNGNVYLCVVGASSGATAPAASIGTTSDGACSWAFVSTVNSELTVQ